MSRHDDLYEVYRATGSARSVEYREILERTQEHCSEKHSELLIADSTPQTMTQLKDIISSFLITNNYSCDDMSIDDLSEKILADMAGYSILAKWIYMPGVEEVNVNAYDDIEVIYSSGKSTKIPDKFISPQQAIDVVRRMLSKCGMVLDDAVPSVLGYLDKNIRISADKPPIVDEDAGINVSVRIVNQATVTRDKLLEYGSTTPEMLDFVEACVKYGVSSCFAGATGSGKTTLMAWLLSCVPNNERVITIEEGSRELNCVKRDNEGNIINSVVHLLTRPHVNPAMNIDQDLLLERVLRKHPDVIGVGEMRSYEAMTAAEASRTGHTVVTTIHSNSAIASYRRMLTLAKRKYSTMTDDILMQIMIEAFPIIIYTKQLQDGSRKIMDILEGIRYDKEKDIIICNSLYGYSIESNEYDKDGNITITGKYKKRNVMSDGLKERFLDNGIPYNDLQRFLKMKKGGDV